MKDLYLVDGYNVIFWLPKVFDREDLESSRMTADSYIEKESYDRREEYRSIYVVTSDGPEQSQVLGNGAYRVAVDDLIRAVNEDKKVQTTFISHHNNQNLRSEIGRALPKSVQDKLNQLRNGN